MPKSKSVVKRRRQSEKRRLRSRAAKSRIKTLTKSLKSSSKDKKGSQATLSKVISAYDRAAQKGIIHPRAVARKKSRLAKQMGSTAAGKRKEKS